MEVKDLIRKLESELRQMRKNYEEGNIIPLEEFDWGFSSILESRSEYRVQGDT